MWLSDVAWIKSYIISIALQPLHRHCFRVVEISACHFGVFLCYYDYGVRLLPDITFSVLLKVMSKARKLTTSYHRSGSMRSKTAKTWSTARSIPRSSDITRLTGVRGTRSSEITTSPSTSVETSTGRSTADVSCAKLSSEYFIQSWIRTKWIIPWIWITREMVLINENWY